MAKNVRVTIQLPPAAVRDAERYAAANGLSVATAVRVLAIKGLILVDSVGGLDSRAGGPPALSST